MADPQANDWQDIQPASLTQPAEGGVSQGGGDWEPLPPSNFDENTGENVPTAFSGISPETAANKGVVSYLDRLKMSFESKGGALSYLQGKVKEGAFQDVRPIPDAEGKPSAELAVLDKDGKWYRVDPKNGDIADPWSTTKQYVGDLKDIQNQLRAEGQAHMKLASEWNKDVADVAPAVIGGIAGAVSSAAIAAPVLAAGAAGAIASGINTSLGRMVGTYQATPQEQVWDTAFETLLNAGLVGVAGGVKPTAAYVAERWPKVAEMFKNATSAIADSPKSLLKKVFASMSVGENEFDTAVENPFRHAAEMKRLYSIAGKNTQAYQDQAIMDQVDEIKGVADGTRKMLSKIYGAGKQKVLAKVSDNYQANFDDAIADSYRNALSKNVGKMVTPEGKSLYGVDAVNYLDGKGIKGFQVMSQGEMKQLVNSGKAELANDLGYLSTNSEAHKAVSSFYDEMGSFVNANKRQGKEAADNLLNFKRVMSDKAYDIANSEHVQELSGVKALLDDARASVDTSIVKSMDNAGQGAGQAFQSLNAEYSKLQQGFSPLLQARQRAIATDNDRSYATLLNQFLAKPRPGAPARYIIDDAIDLAKSYKLNDLSKDLADRKLSIQVLESAKKFNPLKDSGSKAMDQAKNLASLGAVGLGIQHGSPTLVALGVGMKALETPAAAKLGVALSQGLFKGKQLLSSMPKSEVVKLLSDPVATTSFINSSISGPLFRAQTEQELQSQIQQGQGQ